MFNLSNEKIQSKGFKLVVLYAYSILYCEILSKEWKKRLKKQFGTMYGLSLSAINNPKIVNKNVRNFIKR